MEYFIQMIDALRANPLLGAGVAVVVAVGAFLLVRKPRIQREADARLSTLRRDKADQYTRLRPPH
jgi:hypothetical protein